MSSGVAPRITDSQFHRVPPELAEQCITRALSNETLTTRDAGLIREFIAEFRSTRNISTARANKLAFTLISWRRLFGPFIENTIADLYTGIERLKTAPSQRGTPFKPNTISDHVTILKQFYGWLIENEYSELPERKLQRIRIPPRDTMTKVAADLLSPADVRAMTQAATRSVDRALIMTLYEGGFRIGEVCNLRWSNIHFDRYGVIINVNFKTNKPRYVRLVMARDDLAIWRADCRGDPVDDGTVFVNRFGRPFTHGTITKRLSTIAKEAGITRHITPHIFRHSRITHLIREGVSESVIKLMMWGNLSTDMFQTYAHLTGHDIDSAIFGRYGITDEAKPEAETLSPVQCVHCKHINPPTFAYCALCGRSLSGGATADEDEIQRFVLDHPEVLRDFVDQRIRELAEGTTPS